MDSAYLATTDQALDFFQVSESDGLSITKVKENLGKYGKNGKQA